MLNKNAILISFILLLAIATISAASAADLNQTTETASNENAPAEDDEFDGKHK